MSEDALIRKFENQKAEIADKMSGLEARAAFLDKMIAELKKESSKSGSDGTTTRKKGGRKKKTSARRGRKTKGGLTIKDAVHKVIADAGTALTPSEIVPGAAKLSGAAEISVRTQITPLAQSGELVKVDHAGRGFKYGLPGSSAGGAKPKKAPARKSRKKRASSKKRTSSKKRASRKKSGSAAPTTPAAK